MKVLLINGSPHKNGCTNRALEEVAKELNAQGVETEIVWLTTGAVHGCIGCGYCKSNGKCVFDDDVLNSIGQKVISADGYVFGSPVHYSSPTGNMVAIMDRLFHAYGSYMKLKPAAAVVSARRSGTTASYDVLNKYIGINSMLQVPATYWNNVHGGDNRATDVEEDKEGLSVMRAIGSNMAWLIKVLNSVKGTPLEKPVNIPKTITNFIR